MENKPLSFKDIFTNLLVYGSSHALVDLVCAASVFSIFSKQIVDSNYFISLVILYNVLAFGLQMAIGLFSDYFKSPRLVAFLGCIFVMISAFTFLLFPIIAVVFAGVGNALFHIGGGSISLNLISKKVIAPGIFVAPGALGLFVGIFLGKTGQFIAWPFIVVLFIFSLLMFSIKKPKMDYTQEKIPKKESNYFFIILFLILLSIAIRSFIGMVMVFPWKINFDLALILTLSIVLGKGIGGFLADKFGWILVGVGALILSIPFLIFGANIPILAMIGMFLFNITMPITLVAISNILPGRPGFAFGLTCLALIIGALPAFTILKQVFGGKMYIFMIIIISALALYYALWTYYKNYNKVNLVD